MSNSTKELEQEYPALISANFDFEYGKLIQGLSYDQYASLPGLRASDLKKLKTSAKHWKAAQNEKTQDSEALAFGSLFHKAVEDPEHFLKNYILEPEFSGKTKDGRDSTRSAEAKENKAKWYGNLKLDAIVVKLKWKDDLLGMLDSVLNNPHTSKLIRDGVRETSLVVKDPHTGVDLKCRPDFISSKGHLVDIKTTRNPRNPFFKFQIFSSKYEEDPFYCLQAAHYAHCARVSQVCNGDLFFFVAIEKTPPYEVVVWKLDEACIGPGEQWRQHLTELYADCIKRDHYPFNPEHQMAADALTPPEWCEVPINLND